MSVTEVQVESYVFPPAVKPPSSATTFFLRGAGVRGLDSSSSNLLLLECIWKITPSHRSPLCGRVRAPRKSSPVTGPFQKFTKVTTILPLTGQQYSEKVAENCVAYWKAVGKYTDAESETIQKFLEVFKHKNFPPEASILFTQSPHGLLTVSFSKDDSIPEHRHSVIENKQLSEAVLESISPSEFGSETIRTLEEEDGLMP